MILRRVRLRRDPLVRVALVATLLAAVSAAAFGAGYRGSRAVLDDGSAYVQKGHTVVHVNAESGQADAQAARDLATGTQRLEIVQVRPGVVYVVNNETDQVWQLPTDTMRPEQVPATPPAGAAPPAGGAPPGGGAPPAGGPASPAPGTPPVGGSPTPGQTQLVAGGQVAYLLDTARGTLALLDGRRSSPVALPARVDEVVVDGSGTAWALSRAEGTLFTVDGTQLRDRTTVAAPGEAVRLTLAGDKPIVYVPDRHGEGLARMLGPGVRHPEIAVTAAPDGALRIARPGADAPVLVTLDQRDDTVTTVDFRTGEEQHLALQGRGGSRSYGRPVLAREHIYVPDFTRRQVVVLELKPLRQIRAVPVPGPGGTFDVFARDGRVWVNDPYARTLLSFDRAQWRDADKGPGNAVVDGGSTSPPPPSVAPPPPAPTTTPGRTQRPPRSPAPPRPTSSAPPRLIDVPDVRGVDNTAACARITAAGLRCAPPATTRQPGCETGLALNSNPAAGSKVRAGTQVTVVLCGPTAVPGPLLGIHVDPACRTVELAGLVCARHDGGPAASPAQVGVVSRQDPAPGTQVANRSTVNLWYFTGVRVPQITGVSPDQACAALQGQGLQCAPNPNEVTWEANVVHGQSIAPGTPVAVGTAVGYVYQDNAPMDLHRWKMVGVEVRYLSPCCVAAPPPGERWDQQPDMGGVYSPNANEVPGLRVIYQHRCVRNCVMNRPVAYYYSPSPTPPNGRWRLDIAAFSCFAGQPAGTAPLYAMYNNTTDAWAFAVQNSGEWNVHWSAGYRPSGGPLCHIYYQVPGFP